jgi:flagellin-like hook-associated protein FlgL
LTTKNRGVDGDSVEVGNRELVRAQVAEAKQGSKEVSEGRNGLRQAEIAAQSIADNLILMQNLAVRADGGGLTQLERRALQSEYGRLAVTGQEVAAGSDLQVDKTTEGRSTDIRRKPTRVMDIMRDEIAKFSVSEGNKINFENWAAANSDADIVNNPGKVLDTMRREIAEIGGVIQSIEAAAESLDSVAQAIDGEVEDILRPELRIDDIKTAAEVAHGIADTIEAESAEASEAHAGSVTAEVAALLS